MNNTLRRVCIFTCIVLILCSSVLATERASYQLSSYETNATHIGDGNISILVSVLATGYMDELGASHIFVYENMGGSWVYFDSFYSSDPGMTASDEIFHEDYITCEAYEGGQFKVEIVIFAKDYSGNSDSRICTHYVNT